MVSILNECSGAGIHIFTLGVIKLQCWRGIRQSGCLPNNALCLYVDQSTQFKTQTDPLFEGFANAKHLSDIRPRCSKTLERRQRD